MNYTLLVISVLTFSCIILLYKAFSKPKREQLFDSMMREIEETRELETKIKKRLED